MTVSLSLFIHNEFEETNLDIILLAIQHAGIAFDSWPIAMYLVLSNIVFITVSALITWKCTKDKYSNNVVKAIHNFGSPCYDTPSVQQNQYITLPTHEVYIEYEFIKDNFKLIGDFLFSQLIER